MPNPPDSMPAAARSSAVPTWALALVVPVIAVVAAVVTLTATDDGTSGASPAARAAPATRDAVTIQNFEFSPDPLRVAAGAEVTVANADGAAHTVTADDGSFDTGNLEGGAKATIRVAAPGRYTYLCDIHNYMTGVIEAR